MLLLAISKNLACYFIDLYWLEMFCKLDGKKSDFVREFNASIPFLEYTLF